MLTNGHESRRESGVGRHAGTGRFGRMMQSISDAFTSTWGGKEEAIFLPNVHGYFVLFSPAQKVWSDTPSCVAICGTSICASISCTHLNVCRTATRRTFLGVTRVVWGIISRSFCPHFRGVLSSFRCLHRGCAYVHVTVSSHKSHKSRMGL